MGPRPPHAEVRRLVELLPDGAVLRRQQRPLGFISYTPATSRAPVCRLPAGSGLQKGRGSRPIPGRSSSTASASMPPTTSRPATNLTLNLGLRWDYTSPLVEKDDRQANFDLTNAARCSPARTGTAARSTTPTRRAGSRASASPTARATAGCSAAATASRSTWKAPAPTCGCR